MISRGGGYDAVLRWRNHPQVRAASLTRHEIGTEEHAAWWKAALVDPARRVLVYERRDVPSGVVTFFDIDPNARSLRSAGTNTFGCQPSKES